MADNTTLNAGSGGDVIATDDISGVKYQIVKQAFGALDTATLVSATNPMPTLEVPLSNSAYAPSTVTSTAYEASHVVKASAGILFLLQGYNSRTSGQFIQIFNSATVPADTTAPAITFWVPAQSNFSIDFSKFGRYFSTGISVSNSSTGATKTIGSGDVWFDALFI